jgi:preprotein translocase subunit SecG
MIFFVVLHVLACLFLILVVLIQPAKGADFSSLGGGATQTFFGARGALSMLVKVTVGVAAVFFATSLTLGLFSAGATSTVLPDDATANAPETPSSEAPAALPETVPASEAPKTEDAPAAAPAQDSGSEDKPAEGGSK